MYNRGEDEDEDKDDLEEGGAAARYGNEDRDVGRDRMAADRVHEEQEGVFAPTVGLISIKMIIETIKILLKKEPAYLSKLYMTNTLSNESNLIEIKQDKDCFCSTN